VLSLAGVFVALAYSFVRWRPFRVEVSGRSMAPTLVPGDWALAVASRRLRLRRSDVVVIEHPHRPGFEMVKRIVAGAGDVAPDGRVLGPGEWWVEGDAPEASTDSRAFGPVASERIVAVVRLIYWPPGRRRLLGAALPKTRPGR